MVSGDVVRSGTQAGFRALGSVHHEEGRDQRLRRSLRSVLGTQSLPEEARSRFLVVCASLDAQLVPKAIEGRFILDIASSYHYW
jgi:hypothetical protein